MEFTTVSLSGYEILIFLSELIKIIEEINHGV